MRNNTARIDTTSGATRTASIAHGSAGRPATTTLSCGTGRAEPTTPIGYDSTTGRPVTTSSPTAGTITKAYDTLGRQIAYTDAEGALTATEYDRLDRPVKVAPLRRPSSRPPSGGLVRPDLPPRRHGEADHRRGHRERRPEPLRGPRLR